MRRFAWQHPKGASRRADAQADVTVRLNKGGKDQDGYQRYAVAFRFSPEAATKVAQTYEHVTFALDGDKRIYFRGCCLGEGWTLNKTIKGEAVRPYFTATSANNLYWVMHQGSYNLLLDREENLYYIDLEKRLR